jgi:hypothetical protein
MCIEESDWILDSGHTGRVSGHKDWMCDYLKSEGKGINIANSERLVCKGQGNVKVITDGSIERTITDIMHVPDISVNLLSVNKLAEKGFILIFDRCKCQVYRESDVIVKGVRHFSVTNVKGLYKLRSVGSMPDQRSTNGCNVASNPSNIALAAVSQETYHQHLGHLNSKRTLLLKDLAHEINFEENPQIPNCVPCTEANIKTKTFPKGRSRQSQGWSYARVFLGRCSLFAYIY